MRNCGPTNELSTASSQLPREQAPSATHYVVSDACCNELNLTRKGKRALADRRFCADHVHAGRDGRLCDGVGQTASDDGIVPARYAKALAEEIVKPGLEAATMFRRVASRVLREIGQATHGSAVSTRPEVYFAGQAATPPPLVALVRT